MVALSGVIFNIKNIQFILPISWWETGVESIITKTWVFMLFQSVVNKHSLVTQSQVDL